jgi:hypothetical protein
MGLEGGTEKRRRIGNFEAGTSSRVSMAKEGKIKQIIGQFL